MIFSTALLQLRFTYAQDSEMHSFQVIGVL